ncbi:FMN-binding negative transcriptional regulator [Sphingomonas sp. LH128]|uniref:FMN-binding negative transcriptional regulator n=1 Tax=Novosphingobium resinovorum TaxID=158500 RepID=A0A031J3U7_9SPHN|nr:FMN-binding negative transcriptional regulator [Sphingomonas sp. LH128]EJU10778.1 FMN-binding negative transcriptional regulator [Sphingomonas sp. LH128]EZP68514.1 FMN-binding negative transcriptional regulator [Novosphingobium resinovorum]
MAGESGAGVSELFERFDGGDVRDLIAEFPLAWVCAAAGGADHASLLPLLGEYDPEGRLTHLVGHMARRNPLYAALSSAPRALVLFNGPDGYVSPAQAGLDNWAPTWNFAQLRIEAEVTFEPDRTEEALDLLAARMDDGTGWGRTMLGPRYTGMLEAIVGFRAQVTRVAGKFKLGQDERPETLRSIVARHPDPVLVRWMRRFNEERI